MRISFFVSHLESNFMTYAKTSRLYLNVSNHKKIALVAAVVFSLIAISYVIYCKKFKASKQDQSKKSETISPEATLEKETVGSKKKSSDIKKDELSKQEETVEKQIVTESPESFSEKKDEDLDLEHPSSGEPIILEPEITESEISEIELEVPHAVFGKFIQSKDNRPLPSLIGLQTGNITVIEQYHDLTTAFASCFHTTESHQEILDRITALRIKNDSYAEMFGAKSAYCESFTRLMNNLIRLHECLPGEKAKKEVKIYWNENIETILFPYLFKIDNIKIEDLVFEIIPGEHADSHFQAAEMNFEKQLQFVDLATAEFKARLHSEYVELVENVCGVSIDTFTDTLHKLTEGQSASITGNSMFDTANQYTEAMVLIKNLRALKAKKTTIIALNKISRETQKEFIRKLIPFADVK